mgnify:CR=1 FL=1
MADFINTEEETSEETQEVQKVKVGEKEYTQEELSKLVGLGEIGAEAEERYNIKLDGVWPKFGQAIDQVKKLEAELEQSKQVQAPKDPNAELTPEEIGKQARAEAKKLGLLTIEDANEYVDRRIEAIELRKDVQSVVEEAEEKYGIKTAEDTILNHMVETGIKNPIKALKDLYEEKIDAWKEQQLQSLKKPGMATETTTTAGAKEPQVEPITRDNLSARIDEVLNRES